MRSTTPSGGAARKLTSLMPRPIVGVTGGELTAERQKAQHAIRSALHAAGSVPILLRPGEGAAALDRVHGLVLPGGGDIDPRRYGEEPTAELRDLDPEREDLEIELAREAVARGTPVLGICLGLQVLTVALGGTLVQHIEGHDGDDHEVRLDPASVLARIVGAATITTNSSHHQAPKDLPPLLQPVGRTRDGVIEAVEGPGFTIGVGWHPERSDNTDSKRLLQAFVAAVTKQAARSAGS
jgi:putative glutamine amidotransferase